MCVPLLLFNEDSYGHAVFCKSSQIVTGRSVSTFGPIPTTNSARNGRKPLFSASFWPFLVHFWVVFVKIMGLNVSQTALNFFTS